MCAYYGYRRLAVVSQTQMSDNHYTAQMNTVITSSAGTDSFACEVFVYNSTFTVSY